MDVFQGAMRIAREAYPGLDPEAYRAMLDDFAARLDGPASVERVNGLFFGELGFRGNAEDYDDPRNCYLNDVLERRTGIPITLSVVYMELGRRLGLKLAGVPFPGHFLVALKSGGKRLILDPYNNGQALGEPVLRRRIAELFTAEVEDIEPFLKTAGTGDILVRMLNNLKSVYRQRGEPEHALKASSQILKIAPQRAEEYRDRGLLLLELDRPRTALSDLGEYIKRRPDARDADALRETVFELKSRFGRLN